VKIQTYFLKFVLLMMKEFFLREIYHQEESLLEANVFDMTNIVGTFFV
jgi:hypothetical protein